MRKKVLIVIGVIVAIIVLVFAGMVIYDLNQESKLEQEFTEINELVDAENLDMDAINERLERTVTTGDYAVLEKSLKNYLTDLLNIINSFVKTVDDDRLLNLFTIENYQTDGPNFTETTAYINEVKNKINESNQSLKEMLTEKKAMTYLADDLDEELTDLYKTEFAEEIASINYDDTEKEMNSLIDLLNVCEEIIDFLKQNSNNWEIDNGTIVFYNEELLNKYNELLDKAQEISTTYDNL